MKDFIRATYLPHKTDPSCEQFPILACTFPFTFDDRLARLACDRRNEFDHLADHARASGRFDSSYYTPLECVGLFWHLVDLIWIYLFPLLYLIG